MVIASVHVCTSYNTSKVCCRRLAHPATSCVTTSLANRVGPSRYELQGPACLWRLMTDSLVYCFHMHMLCKQSVEDSCVHLASSSSSCTLNSKSFVFHANLVAPVQQSPAVCCMLTKCCGCRPAPQPSVTSPSRLLVSAYLWQLCKCVSSQTLAGWTWLVLVQTTGRSSTTPRSLKHSTQLTH